jgi:O-antigen ligase
LNKTFKNYILNGSNLPSASSLDLVLVALTFLSVLFVPSIKINSQLFLGLDEFLVVIMGIRLVSKNFFWIDQLVMILILMSIFILVSIIVNPNFSDYREYLEVHKVIKFSLFYVFAIFVFKDCKHEKGIVYFLTISFIVLFIFNFLHLFNVFYFNEYVTILFDTDGRDVLNFGKNSAGGPGPKRMVGTMGNPNINAILFLFYVSFFTFLIIEVKKAQSSWKFLSNTLCKVLFFLSILMVILCQSRTGICALFVIYFLGVYLRRAKWSEVIIEISFTSLFFLLSSFIDTIALQYLFNTKPKLQDNNSFSVRLEIWAKLLKMWGQKPFFGYGPNKEYVYSKELHPENEYIFYLWRYGIQGLFLYFSMLLAPVLYYYKRLKEFYFLPLIVLVILIVALMNNPLSNAKINVLLPMILGLSVAFLSKNSSLEIPK